MDQDKDLLQRLGLNFSLKELQAIFQENDLSAASLMDMDYENMDGDTVAFLEFCKSLLDAKWEPLSQAMGLQSTSDHYSNDHPLMALRNNIENLAAGGVYKIIEYCLTTPDIGQRADQMLQDAVEAAMRVMDYSELAQVMREMPAPEDFNYGKLGNHRAQDFQRKWNHSRAQIKTVPLEEAETLDIADESADVEAQALSAIKAEHFWESLEEEDKQLLELKLQGLTQQEIADALAYKTHSAVGKRLQKPKKQFEEMN